MTTPTTRDYYSRNILGQFARGGRQRPEPADALPVEPLDLTAMSPTDVVENAQADFFAPALPRSAEQLVKFWTEVPIPPDVVLAFQDAYHKVHRLNPARKVRDGRLPRPTVHAGEARYLIRAARLFEEAKRLPDNERSRVHGHPLPYPDDTGQARTVPEIYDRFKLQRLDELWTLGQAYWISTYA